MIPYRLKRLLLGPYRAVQRHRFRNESDFIRAVLEELNYSRGILAYRAQGGDQKRDDASGLTRNSIALDVGGFKGDWARTVHRQSGCQVYVFEAFPLLAEEIESACVEIPDVRIFDYGLAGEDKKVPFSFNGPGSTALKYPGREHRFDWEVQMRDISNVFEELGLDEVDLMKVNIEGGEYELLPRMIDCNLLRRCGEIRVQFHEWIPGAHTMRQQIRANLAQTHREKWNFPFVWECWIRKDMGGPSDE